MWSCGRIKKVWVSVSIGIVLSAPITFTHSAFASTRSVCVVPDDRLSTSKGCISASALPGWLRTTHLRDTDKTRPSERLITFEAGVYTLRQPLLIDQSAIGVGSQKLLLQGAGSGKTIFTGSVPLDFSSPSPGQRTSPGLLQAQLSDIGVVLPKIPAERRFGQRSAPDLELFFQGQRMPVARWPDSGFASVRAVEAHGGRLAFSIAGRDGTAYEKESSLMVGGYFFHNWADELIRAQSGSDGLITFASKPPQYGIAAGRRIWFENGLIDLNKPGEWQVDYPTGQIRFLPPGAVKKGDIEVSVGNAGLVLTEASNVSVSGMSFQNFLQAGVVVDKSSNILLNDVEVSNIGGDGVRLGGNDLVFENGKVSQTGGAGISIGGGNRTTLAPGNITVRRSIVQAVGRLHKTYKPAILLNGVGNSVENNHFRDGPHIAILFHGNDHRIAGNLIERFVLETDDAGAVYTGQDWTERGTVIEGNVIRQIGGADAVYGANAIYLDDQASGITVRGNLIYGARRGVFIGGGRDNIVSENLIAKCREGIYIDARGVVDKERYGMEAANRRYIERMRKVPVDSREYRLRYPALAALEMDDPGTAKNNVANRNLFASCQPLVVKQPAWNALNFKISRSIATDLPIDFSAVSPEDARSFYLKLWDLAIPVAADTAKVIK